MRIEAIFDDGMYYKGTIIGVDRQRESFSLTVWFDDDQTLVGINYPENGVRIIKDEEGNAMFDNRFTADIDTASFINVTTISQVGN